jgi:ABC-type iron transport system FetAB ATPase subunit
LLRAIADLDPHQGEARLDGVPAHAIAAPIWRRRVGLLPAESRWWTERVGDHFGHPPPDWLAGLGLPAEVFDWTVSRLSSGERQRLALARLLENRPEVLLLDEPTANLDPENTERVQALLRGYQRSRGAALLWVSHDRGQLERMTGRILEMPAGRWLGPEPPVPITTGVEREAVSGARAVTAAGP